MWASVRFAAASVTKLLTPPLQFLVMSNCTLVQPQLATQLRLNSEVAPSSCEFRLHICEESDDPSNNVHFDPHQPHNA